MKLVILASGRGTRLQPLTNTIPKPMIRIAGQPIIEHNIEKIYNSVDEIVIVVKYLKEVFSEYFGNNYKGTPVRYHEQGEEKGTAAALRGLEIEDDIIVINGDSIFEQNDLDLIVGLEGYGCLVKAVIKPELYGIFLKQVDGTAMKVVEKPQDYIGNLASMGVYKFSSSIISLSEQVSLSERGEYELTDAVNFFCAGNKFQLLEMQGDFIDIGYPWQILQANDIFLSNLKQSVIKGDVEDGVTIKGNILLEEGAVLKSGTYIEGNCYIGKNTIIGPNTYLRGNTIFGNNSKAGNAVEIKNSTIGDYTNIAHLSYIGDSVIGNNVNIGGGFITANLRHDRVNIRSLVNGKLIDTGLKKFGCIIGDNSKTGINTSVYPGRVLSDGSFTMPSEIVK